MITVSAADGQSSVDYSSIIEEVLLDLRRELRMDLSQIVRVNWDKEAVDSVENQETLK